MFIFVYLLLIIQLIFFLLSNLLYIYQNPQYRACRDVFCSASDFEVSASVHEIALTANNEEENWAGATQSSHASQSTPANSSTKSNILERSQQLIGQSANVPNSAKKQTLFISYGLEIVSHSILMQIYLITLIFLLCCRLLKEHIDVNYLWSDYQYFCGFVCKVMGFAVIPQNVFQIVVCIPAIKLQHSSLAMHTSKCQRKFANLSIVYMILSILVAFIHWMLINSCEILEYEGVFMCVHRGGFRTNNFFTMYILIQWYVSYILCFIVVFIPVYQQRKMLVNLPKSEDNHSLATLIQKVNRTSRRICISAVIFIVMWTIINILTWVFSSNPDMLPIFTIGSWIAHVEAYMLIMLIYKDWKVRLCTICHYKYMQRTVTQLRSDQNPVEIQLVSDLKEQESSNASIALPQLVKDVSAVRDCERTFS